MSTGSVREIVLSSLYQRRQLSSFMEKQGIRLDDDTEFAVGIFDDNDELLACGGHAKNILKGFAVDPSQRGNNLLGTLISTIIARQISLGYSLLRVFTKPGNTRLFESSGFSLIASGAEAALLESKKDGVQNYLKTIPTEDVTTPACALVMNCNPFTLGHRYLVAHATRQYQRVYIFVVEEDSSFFPFKTRFELVKKGCADFPQVVVCPSGPYMISAATFPTYFIKEKSRADFVRSDLDAILFASQIAPALNIKKRFVGTEPVCLVTKAYNETLATILPRYAVDFEEVQRTEVMGKVISASLVRSTLLETGVDAKELEQLLPPSSLTWLRSEEGREFIRQKHS